MRKDQGQSIVEYAMIITILSVVLYYMGTGIKRGVQSLVKVTSDQVGSQEDADQDFGVTPSGYMTGSNAQMHETKSKQTREIGYIPKNGTSVYVTNTSFNETTDAMTNTLTNGGYSPT